MSFRHLANDTLYGVVALISVIIWQRFKINEQAPLTQKTCPLTNNVENLENQCDAFVYNAETDHSPYDELEI